MPDISPSQFENWKAASVQEKLALRVLKLLAEAGFAESYFVGGYVRDLFLGRVTDPMIDIATEAPPKAVEKLFLKRKFRVIPTGLKHGTLTVRKNGEQVEITTFRTEGKYEAFRRPKAVKYVTSPKTDAGRRDFTVNALYFNPATGKFLDFFGGLKDLHNRRLRFIGSAKARISEDALRLMRAVRFATVLDFRLSPKDERAIKSLSPLIKRVSAERIKQELDRLIFSPRRSSGLKLMSKTGLLSEVLPEIDRLKKTKQSSNYHSEGSVFVHTLLALDMIEPGTDLTALYGMLFHDAGKGLTAVKTRKHGREHVSFHGHQETGEKLVRQILPRLRFSKKDTDDIAWYVRHHHIPVDIPKMRTAKQVRWLLEPRFGNLLKIFRADSSASIPTDSKGRKLPADLNLYKYSLRLFRAVQQRPVLQERFLGGQEIMRVLKIKPGPRVGQMLERIREKQLEGKIKNRKQALEYLKKM